MGCCCWGSPYRHRCGPPSWWYEEARGIAVEPPRRTRRSPEELEDYLEELEAELRRVRRELARAAEDR